MVFDEPRLPGVVMPGAEKWLHMSAGGRARACAPLGAEHSSESLIARSFRVATADLGVREHWYVYVYRHRTRRAWGTVCVSLSGRAPPRRLASTMPQRVAAV